MPTPIEPFYTALGRRIQDLRATRGITQEELGRRLSPSLTRASIANIETGKQRIYAHTLLDFARALDVVLADLLPEAAAARGLVQQGARQAHDQLGSELTSKLKLRPEQVRELVLRIGMARDEGSKS